MVDVPVRLRAGRTSIVACELPAWSSHCDLLVLPVFADGSVPGVTAAAAQHFGFDPARIAGRFGLRTAGDLCTVAVSGLPDGPDVMLVCVGRSAEDVTPEQLRRAAQRTGRSLDRRRVICALAEIALPGVGAASLVTESLLLGSYEYSAYRTEPADRGQVETILLSGVREDEIRTGRILGEAVNYARDLVNSPSADLTPVALADCCTDIAGSFSLRCEVLGYNDLVAGGFGGIAAVGRGSSHEPALAVLELATGTGPVTALIGKGITFDSGGIQIKEASAMPAMKYDMAGAAAGLAAVRALSELGVPANIRLYLACAENAPDGKSYRPSDVVRHRSGRTTEIVSTDAEGRLVLADAIGYALERNPDEVVTVSTLTGGTGLGPGLWGVLGTSASLVSSLLDAGGRAGDPGWQLPLWDDYAPMLRSAVADARNYDFSWPRSAVAGAPPAILGGMFLRPFVGDVPWAHIDMAAAAWQMQPDGLWVAGATGRPTAALVEHFMARADNQ